jgi:hypothetical protein
MSIEEREQVLRKEIDKESTLDRRWKGRLGYLVKELEELLKHKQELCYEI